MMECKKALVEADGDLDRAVSILRKRGLAKADKKAGRTAAEGCIVSAGDAGGAVLLEVNCETDFTSGNENFTGFAASLAETILGKEPADVETLNAATLQSGESVEEARRGLVAKIGENISIRRFECFHSQDGVVGVYLHGARIGVMVDLVGGDEALARDLAMHVAASRPVCVNPEEVPEDKLAAEREVIRAQSQASGKPAEIIEKMIAGRLKKFVNEIALVGQPFVKNPDQNVGALLRERDARVRRFVRFEVGEGIEREETDFAAEVAAQAQGN
ncbi:MAG: translation elongation factor Ts [Gammaproteobacteria bacterium]|nr:translation elongation factor Ts [Gammaproteobacteria bacterium]